MSCSLNLHLPKALPSLSNFQHTNPSLSIASKTKQFLKHSNSKKESLSICSKLIKNDTPGNSTVGFQIGAFLATVAQPAMAVTGVNNEEDFTWVLIQLGISAFFYFLVFPPIILNWLRIRWYKRDLLEMYVQFMFVFMFFPGCLLWAPFLNFRKFPRDPSMKYPWSVPEDPSKIKNVYRKFPWATPEDYE